MTTLSEYRTDEERVVARFTKYLNGPMGRTVLDNLDDGEHFILQTSQHTLKVTKQRGRAVVSIIRVPLV
ncbi:MAG: hypothetical protein JW779_12565 [Candidatus Thorarchaeota archaeon]|nr:hypothetical protein [Candidatus Thorarchaeota archaeon]